MTVNLKREEDVDWIKGYREIDQDTSKQEEDVEALRDSDHIVQVDQIHDAPDDAVVHYHEEIGLYYVYDTHSVERSDGTRDWTDRLAKDYEYPDAAPADAPAEVREAVQRFRDVVPGDTKEEQPLLYWLLGAGTPAYKMSKEDADYQPTPKGGSQYCGSCEYLYKSNETGDLICSKVSGDVDWMGWCRFYDEAEPDEDLAAIHDPPESREEAMHEDWYPITVIEAMAKQMDFELDIFRIVATDDMDMGLTSDLMAVGVDFPSHDVFVDWRTESWPDGEELDGPHVSIYSTMDDVRDVAQGEIEMITSIDPADRMSKQMSTPPGVPDQAEYLGPDQEAPEGASTYEGPQGATYYVPESTDNPDRASIDDFGGLTQTDAPQTPDIDVDKGDRKEFLSYMSSGYKRVNEALRGDGEMTDDLRRHIDVIGSYIEDAPEFEEPTEVYRGLTASPDLADRLRQAEGEQVELGGFQSTSTNPEVANRFTDFGDEEDVPVMMNIQTQSGLPLENTNLDSGSGGEEQEVLLGHNWTYEIQSVEETGDGLLVDMEVVSDD